MTLNVFAYVTQESIAVLNYHFHVLFTKNDSDRSIVKKLTPFLFSIEATIYYILHVFQSECGWIRIQYNARITIVLISLHLYIYRFLPKTFNTSSSNIALKQLFDHSSNPLLFTVSEK